jgi:hypothetical protein
LLPRWRPRMLHDTPQIAVIVVANKRMECVSS